METGDKKSKAATDAADGAPTGGEREDRSSFLGRLKDAWKESVGTYATDDGETKHLFARLVDFGTLSRDEAVKLLGESRSKIEQNRRELERRVDESIKKATSRLHVPSQAEIEQLSGEIEAIERRIAAIESRRRQQHSN
jgi:polyhydroxyalkanoate synthesis regulator phasin